MENLNFQTCAHSFIQYTYDFYQQYICSTVHMYDFFCEKKKHNMAKMAVITVVVLITLHNAFYICFKYSNVCIHMFFEFNTLLILTIMCKLCVLKIVFLPSLFTQEKAVPFQNMFIGHIQNKVSCLSTNIQYIHQ